jgi:anti-anti-sigma regulatory factor
VAWRRVYQFNLFNASNLDKFRHFFEDGSLRATISYRKQHKMLKITVEKDPEFTTLKLEGSLNGLWLDELKRVWRDLSASGTPPFVLDLTSVTFISDEGKKVLRAMSQQGVRMKAQGCLISAIIREIQNGFRTRLGNP